MKFPILEINKHFDSINTIQGIFSVFGDFGVGKTTFALQIATGSAKIGKNVIYVYTKHNLPSEKILIISSNSKEILDNILFIQTINFDELNKIIFNFEFLILNHINKKKINYSLIVIDSITNLYRLELNKINKEKNYELNYKLNQMLANLTYLNETYDIEILIINEISRKNINNQIIELQTGGKVMEYWVNYQLKIARTKKLNERKLILTKYPEENEYNFMSFIKKKGFE
ncbi:MAG: hypothetical protein ACFE91_04740 [Promethearchaeota archaeon]